MARGSPVSRGPAHSLGLLKSSYIPTLNVQPSKTQHLATEKRSVRKRLVHAAGEGLWLTCDESLRSPCLSWQTDWDRKRAPCHSSTAGTF